ncbi:hypothetical protein CDAR_570391 [Caerostris darwini]|uniref:Uncharacterized protein n=1 Tax=Caerostris darwini TaxID=1538125 RepID=A0AAV4MEB8_9ARAC|nr:hypothetical protein CDAR_570391 [Caerostris darwini]
MRYPGIAKTWEKAPPNVTSSGIVSADMLAKLLDHFIKKTPLYWFDDGSCYPHNLKKNPPNVISFREAG